MKLVKIFAAVLLFTLSFSCTPDAFEEDLLDLEQIEGTTPQTSSTVDDEKGGD